MSQFRVEAPGPQPRTVAPPSPSGGSRLTERVEQHDHRWFDRAGCRGLDGILAAGAGSVWLEPQTHPQHVVEAAMRVCATCPVWSECCADAARFAAVHAYEPSGIWGGRYHRRQRGQSDGTIRALVSCARCSTLFAPLTERSVLCAGCRAPKPSTRPDRGDRGSLPSAPLLAYVGARSVSRIAEVCRVSRRTVQRWQAGTNVQSPAWIASNLDATIKDIWGDQ